MKQYQLEETVVGVDRAQCVFLLKIVPNCTGMGVAEIGDGCDIGLQPRRRAEVNEAMLNIDQGIAEFAVFCIESSVRLLSLRCRAFNRSFS